MQNQIDNEKKPNRNKSKNTLKKEQNETLNRSISQSLRNGLSGIKNR